MRRFVIGVDPDAEAHGVAIYDHGKLVQLTKANLVQLLDIIKIDCEGDAYLSIENVAAKSFVYARNVKKNKALMAKVGVSIGRCQQSQIELCRMLDHHRITYELHLPKSGNWADTKLKSTFERITGWQGRSNADNRSAAFFGWLALKNS